MDMLNRWMVWQTTLYPTSAVAVTRVAIGPVRWKWVRPMRPHEYAR